MDMSSWDPNEDSLPLVGHFEIASRAGVQRQVIHMWIKRYESFPQPVATLKMGPVWWWPTMEAWLIKMGKRTDANWSEAQVSPRARRHP